MSETDTDIRILRIKELERRLECDRQDHLRVIESLVALRKDRNNLAERLERARDAKRAALYTLGAVVAENVELKERLNDLSHEPHETENTEATARGR